MVANMRPKGKMCDGRFAVRNREHRTLQRLVERFFQIAAFVSAGLAMLVHLLDCIVGGVGDDVVGASLEVSRIELAHQIEDVGDVAVGGGGAENYVHD